MTSVCALLCLKYFLAFFFFFEGRISEPVFERMNFLWRASNCLRLSSPAVSRIYSLSEQDVIIELTLRTSCILASRTHLRFFFFSAFEPHPHACDIDWNAYSVYLYKYPLLLYFEVKTSTNGPNERVARVEQRFPASLLPLLCLSFSRPIFLYIFTYNAGINCASSAQNMKLSCPVRFVRKK